MKLEQLNEEKFLNVRKRVQAVASGLGVEPGDVVDSLEIAGSYRIEGEDHGLEKPEKGWLEVDPDSVDWSKQSSTNVYLTDGEDARIVAETSPQPSHKVDVDSPDDALDLLDSLADGDQVVRREEDDTFQVLTAGKMRFRLDWAF